MPTAEPLTDTLYPHCEVCSDNNLTVAVWTGPPLLVTINHPLQPQSLSLSNFVRVTARSPQMISLCDGVTSVCICEVLNTTQRLWMYFLAIFNGFVLWVMTSRGLTNGSQRFEGTDCLHFQVLRRHFIRNGDIKVSKGRIASIFRDYDRVNW